jgi:hypothetical protein
VDSSATSAAAAAFFEARLRGFFAGLASSSLPASAVSETPSAASLSDEVSSSAVTSSSVPVSSAAALLPRPRPPRRRRFLGLSSRFRHRHQLIAITCCLVAIGVACLGFAAGVVAVSRGF